MTQSSTEQKVTPSTIHPKTLQQSLHADDHPSDGNRHKHSTPASEPQIEQSVIINPTSVSQESVTFDLLRLQLVHSQDREKLYRKQLAKCSTFLDEAAQESRAAIILARYQRNLMIAIANVVEEGMEMRRILTDILGSVAVRG